MIVSHEWVYNHLICEFDHWDICLDGLVDKDGEKWWCTLVSPNPPDEYLLSPIEWTDECTEYLEDYRKAYVHWFYENGKKPPYDGRPLNWFSEKWPNNPIEQAVK